jgi:hypothetical protein
MSISIQYSGRLNSQEMMLSLMEELIDVCVDMHWDYAIIDHRHAEDLDTPPLTGLLITVSPKCEPLPILMDSKGRLRSQIALMYYEEDEAYQFKTEVETLSAGARGHATIVNLLDYIRRAYCDDLVIEDKTEFLKNDNFERLEFLFDQLSEDDETILESAELQHVDDVDELLDKLLLLLKKKIEPED